VIGRISLRRISGTLCITMALTVAVPIAPAAIAAPGASISVAVPAGFALDADGSTLVHMTSGFRFPGQVGGFTRLDEHASDPSGEYVAIGYERRLAKVDPIVVRIALVHIVGMTAADHYTIMKPVAMSYFSAVSVLSEGSFSVPAQPDAPAYRGIFTGAREGRPWRFSLTTVDFGYWGARLVSAYPASRSSEAERDLGPLLSAFRWQRPDPPQSR
jgi:hypothetical protein